MSIAFLLWTLAVSALVFGGAAAAAAALRYLGRPERWVWAIALATTALLPFLPRGAADPPTPEEVGVTISAPLSQVLAIASTSLPEQTRVSIPWIPVLWAFGSTTTVFLLLGGAWSLARRRESWPRRRVDGDLLRISEDFGPAVVGWIEPEIVLPAWAVELSPRKRRMILRHENEHRWAHDPQLLALGVLLLAAAPWNPIAWLQFRGLRRAIEFDCDARVLASGASPRAYGRLLVSVQLDGARGALFAPALREPASFLERRLRTMTLRDRPVARIRVLALALTAVGLTVVACETPRPTESVGPSGDPVVAQAPATGGIRLAPTIEAERAEFPDDGVVFLVEESGVVAVHYRNQTQMVTREQVEAVVRTTVHEGTAVFVAVDQDARAGHVLDVQDAVKRAGVDRVGFIRLREGEEYTESEVRERIDAFGVCPDGTRPTTSDGSSGLSVRGCRSAGRYVLDESVHILEERLPSTDTAGTRSIGLIQGEELAQQLQTDSIHVHGIGSLGLTGEDAPLVYVDGVRLSRGSRATVLGQIRPQEIDRIEVIKGETAQRLYGDAAANGVIQIFTKRD